MALRIETFDNSRGGNTLYKALTHPAAAEATQSLLDRLLHDGPVAIYDPNGVIEAFDAIFGLDRIEISGAYVQQIAQIGTGILGYSALPVTELRRSRARTLLIAAFDAERVVSQLQPYLPAEAEVISLDAIRIPESRLTNRSTYLDPLNFATNFAFFRDAGGLHTRLTTANYWAGYGAGAITCWMTLFGDDGAVLADWCESVGAGGSAIVIDSREVREHFGLAEFTGQLFFHVVGAAGHDIVKYALDTFGSPSAADRGESLTLSCTHDANAWPADRYAGLPAPGVGEQVVLWIQNSHPVPIPSRSIGLNRMGEDRIAFIAEPIAPYASRAIDVSGMLLGIAWPRQIELRAGKHMVRPRYEVDRERTPPDRPVNVESGDLAAGSGDLPEARRCTRQGLPLAGAGTAARHLWQTHVLPTPMALRQTELPVAARVYNPDGR